MAKVIPIERRGRLLGLRDMASGTMLIGVAAVGGWARRALRLAGQRLHVPARVRPHEPRPRGLRVGARARRPRPPERGRRSRAAPRGARAAPRRAGLPPLPLGAPLRERGARRPPPLHRVARPRARDERSAARRLDRRSSPSRSRRHVGWGWLGDRAGYKRRLPALELVRARRHRRCCSSSRARARGAHLRARGASLGGFVLAGSNLVLEFGYERDRAMRIAVDNASTELVGMVGYSAPVCLRTASPFTPPSSPRSRCTCSRSCGRTACGNRAASAGRSHRSEEKRDEPRRRRARDHRRRRPRRPRRGARARALRGALGADREARHARRGTRRRATSTRARWRSPGAGGPRSTSGCAASTRRRGGRARSGSCGPRPARSSA